MQYRGLMTDEPSDLSSRHQLTTVSYQRLKTGDWRLATEN
jgi:hypothetical protein